MSQVTSAQNDQQDIKEKRHRLLLDKAQRKVFIFSQQALQWQNQWRARLWFSQKSHRLHL